MLINLAWLQRYNWEVCIKLITPFAEETVPHIFVLLLPAGHHLSTGFHGSLN